MVGGSGKLPVHHAHTAHTSKVRTAELLINLRIGENLSGTLHGVEDIQANLRSVYRVSKLGQDRVNLTQFQVSLVLNGLIYQPVCVSDDCQLGYDFSVDFVDVVHFVSPVAGTSPAME
jgi:hypothetical protein